MVMWLEGCEDLHVAQMIPLPLTVSCFSKIQIGFAFLVPAHPGSPGKRAVKRVCVCVILCENMTLFTERRLWIPRPVQLRNPDITYGLFRRQLKGHLFREA